MMRNLGTLLIKIGYKMGGYVPLIVKAVDWESRKGVWLTSFNGFNPSKNKLMVDYDKEEVFVSDI